MSQAPGSPGITTPTRPSATTATPASHRTTVMGSSAPGLAGLLAGALLRELRREPLFHRVDGGQVALRVHEAVRIVGIAGLVLLVQTELAGVRGQEHVHGQGLLRGERAGVVLANGRVLRHAL